MPTVRAVTGDSMAATSTLNVARSKISQNTGVAPMYSTTFGVAWPRERGSIASSPGPRPTPRPLRAVPSYRNSSRSPPWRRRIARTLLERPNVRSLDQPAQFEWLSNGRQLLGPDEWPRDRNTSIPRRLASLRWRHRAHGRTSGAVVAPPIRRRSAGLRRGQSVRESPGGAVGLSVLSTRWVTNICCSGRYSGSRSLAEIWSSRSTSSEIVVSTPIPMLKNSSVASLCSRGCWRGRRRGHGRMVGTCDAIAEDHGRRPASIRSSTFVDHAHVRALVVHARSVDVHIAQTYIIEAVLS